MYPHRLPKAEGKVAYPPPYMYRIELEWELNLTSNLAKGIGPHHDHRGQNAWLIGAETVCVVHFTEFSDTDRESQELRIAVGLPPLPSTISHLHFA